MTSIRKVLADEEMAQIEWRDIHGFSRLNIGNGGEIKVKTRDGESWCFPTIVLSPSAKYPQIAPWQA